MEHGYANDRAWRSWSQEPDARRPELDGRKLAFDPGEGCDGRVSAGGATYDIEAVVFEEGDDVQGRFGPGAAAVGADDRAAPGPTARSTRWEMYS